MTSVIKNTNFVVSYNLLYKYIDGVVAVGDYRLATTIGTVHINSLGIPLADHMNLVVVVVVDSMVPSSCPIVQNVSGFKFLVPVAIGPTSVSGTHYIGRPRLIAQIIHLLVDFAVKGEQRNTGFVGNGDLKALR